jgi:hypothetical protein
VASAEDVDEEFPPVVECRVLGSAVFAFTFDGKRRRRHERDSSRGSAPGDQSKASVHRNDSKTRSRGIYGGHVHHSPLPVLVVGLIFAASFRDFCVRARPPHPAGTKGNKQVSERSEDLEETFINPDMVSPCLSASNPVNVFRIYLWMKTGFQTLYLPWDLG